VGLDLRIQTDHEMTTFLDGPAQGKCLFLRHSPKRLRVVEKDGKWDALDAPGDYPRPGETVHRYEFVRRTGTTHVNASRGNGGFFPTQEYKTEPITK